jgi:Polyketide cyclase / dehydrase and lipid transport
MAQYRVLTEWQIEAPVERVWDALLLAREWPAWWRGFRSVEELGPGEQSGVGKILRQRWRSLLPYTLTLDLAVTAIERHRLLEGRASGDMRGLCRWTFEPRGTATIVRFLLDVQPTRAWMNLPVPFARQVFALNYGTIMRWGGEGLAHLLDSPVVGRTLMPAPATA